MKKMISKKLVSLLAAATMLLTSASVVFAANDYTSESGNQWPATAGSANGCVHTVDDDGVLTSTRTLFRNLDTGKEYGANAEGTAWEPTAETKIYDASTTWELDKELSTGKAQAKFNVKFDGGAGQRIHVYFAGYYANTGVRIQKNRISALINGGAYGHTECTFADETWYTVTVTLDMNKKIMSYTVTDKTTGTDIASGSRDFSSTITGATSAVTGLTFTSPAAYDHTNRNAETVTATDGYPASVWHIANVTYDAYTETNYVIDSVWRNTSGISINKETAYYNYQGMTLTRLTNFDDPANASFITAGYDEEDRMGNAVVTPLSAMGATPVNPNVGEYATVKSFIMDTNTATPFVKAYSYATPATTKKWFDFETGYSAPTGDAGVTFTKVEDGTDNNALKIERSMFRNSKNYSWVNNAWTEDTTTTFANKAQELQFGATVKEFELSFRLKFDGTENGAGRQAACIWLGELSGSPIGIRRAANGTVTLTHNNGNWASSVCTMNAGEWYDFTMAVTVNGTVNIAWTIEKDGKVIATANKDLANVSNVTTGYGKVNIGSRRDDDLIVTSTTEVTAENTKTTTSVWYIDDLAVKY